MIITRIEKQKKQASRYSIYLDDNFWLGVSEDVLLKHGLFKGQEINENSKVEIEKAESNQKIYQRALNYLSFGLRSINEMKQYLIKHREEYTDVDNVGQVIENTVDKLIEQGYLNDEYFARSYIRTQARLNLRGPSIIQQELKAKGIDDAEIVNAMEEYPIQQQAENIQTLTDKFIKSKNKTTPISLKQKLYQHLLQKGYPSELIKSNISELSFSDIVTDQTDLIDKEGQKLLKRYTRKYEGYEIKQKLTASLYRKGFTSELINTWLAEIDLD